MPRTKTVAPPPEAPIIIPETKMEAWKANPECARWLNSAMGSLLIDVLDELHELRLNDLLPPQFIMANGAAVAGRVAGYERCMRTIRSLRQPAAQTIPNLIETYGVTKPEHATE